jgi:ABC-type sugar transport system permease subunit
VAYAVTGIFYAVLNWLLRGFSRSSLILPLILAALNFLIGVKLLQLRYWALIAGRIIALWGVVGYIALVAIGRLAAGPPVVTLARLADIIITVAIAITIFMPSVSKAIRAPSESEST